MSKITMKEKILNLLKENENKFVSGEELSNKFGVSRTTIWNNLKKLKEEGYFIESSSKKGYKLLNNNNIYNREEIKFKLLDRIKDVVYFDKIDSTNEYAKKYAIEHTQKDILVVANTQSMGKGRLGRAWVSPKDTGIWMSLILKPNLLPRDASKITQIASSAILTAFKEITDLDVFVKWPNDIIINGKKVAGILIEMNTEIDAINHLIVGIGINVNTKEFPDEISDVATSLYIEDNKKYDRIEIISKILKWFYYYYDKLIIENDFSEVLDLNVKKSITLNKDVIIIKNGVKFEVFAEHLNSEGELVVKHKDGRYETVFSGEVSVRGVLGYTR